MDFGKMTLKEMVKVRDGLNAAIDDACSLESGDYLTSEEGQQLLQECENLRTEGRKLRKSSIKLRIEVDLDVKLLCDDLDFYVTDSTTYLDDIFDVSAEGKLAQSQKYPRAFVSEVNDTINDALNNVCSNILKFDPNMIEAIKQFKTKLKVHYKKLEVARKNYGIESHHLEKGMKK